VAITFGSRQKKEKNLILLLVVMVAFGVVVVSFILGQRSTPLFLEPSRPAEPKINWNFLSSPLLQKLQPLQEIPLLDGEPGRENPFLPY